MKFLFKSLLLIPDGKDIPNGLDQIPKEWDKPAQSLNEFFKYDGDITFIIGPWGSGKSTFISTILGHSKTYTNLKKPHRISLSTATTLDEVFSHLVPTWIKLLYIIIAIAVSITSLQYYTWPEIFEHFLQKNRVISFFGEI